MKGIILTALLALGTAASAAGIVATLANEAGGEILLTDGPCHSNKASRIAMSTDAGGRILLSGCAVTLPPDRLLIGWDNGHASLLKASDFTLVSAPPFGARDSLPAATESRTTRGHFAKFKR